MLLGHGDRDDRVFALLPVAHGGAGGERGAAPAAVFGRARGRGDPPESEGGASEAAGRYARQRAADAVCKEPDGAESGGGGDDV